MGFFKNIRESFKKKGHREFALNFLNLLNLIY